ncbi:uncharacterized protein LOC107611749 [Arachis ipaensis]|uniref:uncharacterized protein LOC107611749 n=1 Tax=Arachis ipaensis TaxID=130454 RepID=UPI000A2B0422|nr:uncharacterized protein LOC107611749 [Arachis ipaensis]
MSSGIPEALQNRWDAVAACLPDKTSAQIQERFQKLITHINLIHKSYINLHHTSIAPAAPHNMPAPPTTLERNPLSLPGTSEQNQPVNTNIIEHQLYLRLVIEETQVIGLKKSMRTVPSFEFANRWRICLQKTTEAKVGVYMRRDETGFDVI